MKKLIATLAIIGMFGISSVTFAEETLGEKATVTGKDIKRGAKKGAHRFKEEMCGKLTGDSQASCMAKQAKNRATEAKDTVVDKASEVKNAVDTESK